MVVVSNPQEKPAMNGGSPKKPPAGGDEAGDVPGGDANPDGRVPGVVYLTNPKPAIASLTTHLRPFKGTLDPSSKEDLYYWSKSTEVPADWKFPAPGPESMVL